MLPSLPLAPSPLIQGFLIFGAVQSLFFAMLFGVQKRRRAADVIMALWLMLLAFHIGTFYLVGSGWLVSSHWQAVQVSFLLVHGPFLWAYVRQQILPAGFWGRKDWLHFLPYMLVLAGVAMMEMEGRVLFLRGLALMGMISGFAYIVAAWQLLRRHQQEVPNRYSFIEQVSLEWLRRLVIGLLLLWSGGTVLGFASRFLAVDLPLTELFVFVPLFIFYLGYHGIRQEVIPGKIAGAPPDFSVSRQSEKTGRYQKSGLQTEQMERISQRLRDGMGEGKWFLNSTLSLQEVATMTKLPPHHITQALNEHLGLSFHDFVNQYRVAEFQRRVALPQNRHFSLLSIALDCGFNSKSSFNRIFKQATGLTPSAFVKMLSGSASGSHRDGTSQPEG